MWSQLDDSNLNSALRGTVAGVVGMVPEGLVLLTSVAFGVAAVTLARRNVLVQELPAVEGLARVDVVCLDKTGTLTEGEIVFDEIEPLGDTDVAPVLGALAADENRNGTLDALAAAFTAPDGWARTASVPFSSARKWSAATFEGHGSWVMGAPEMVLPDASLPARQRADEIASDGRRVLVLALDRRAARRRRRCRRVSQPTALVMFAEKIRPDAAETIQYFHDQGVTLKVISGDNPRTVAAVAARVGLPGATEAFDARELPEEPQELADVLETHSVFGRVTPQQKRAMVGALQLKGHVVAMTGDGVNDALALKDADIGVAMGSGAAATRAVAQLVLLDGKFAVLPGRRRRRPPRDRQHRALGEPLRDEDRVRDVPGDRGRDRRLEVPVPSSPPHDHQHVHDRHPWLLPRPRAQLASLHPGLRRTGAALHRSGRHRRVRGDDGELRHRAVRPRPRARSRHAPPPRSC